MEEDSSAPPSPAADVRKRKAIFKREREDDKIIFKEIKGDVENLPTLTPCSTTTSSITKQICFWGKSNLWNLDWFVVNISIDPKQQQQDEVNYELAAFDHQLLHKHNYTKNKPLTPVFSFPSQSNVVPLVCNSFTALDSFIYSVGGLFNYPIGGADVLEDSTRSGSNLVHYFDTRYYSSNKYDSSSSSSCCFRWEKAPSMITHRQCPQVVTLNSILYVFGCSGHKKCPHEPSCCVWAEAFDPSTSQWSPLPVPEFDGFLIVSSPSHTKKGHTSKKIYAVADGEYFYEFDIETRCWARIATCERHLVGEDISLPVMVDNILYWFDDVANAYDVLKVKSFEGPVQDLSFQRSLCVHPDEFEFDRTNVGADKPAIVHLGGRYFCLLAYLRDIEQKDTPRRIHCLIVEVFTTNECYDQNYGEGSDIDDTFFLDTRVVSCQSFDIDRELEFIDGRIMIN